MRTVIVIAALSIFAATVALVGLRDAQSKILSAHVKQGSVLTADSMSPESSVSQNRKTFVTTYPLAMMRL